MAINSFGQGVAPSAVPLPVTTASATTSATTTDVTVTWTADTKGAVATAYSVTGVASGGVTTTSITSATSVLLSKQSGGRAYTFTVTAQNAYGNSSTVSPAAVTPPFVYREALVATTTANYTIPTGYSKMAAIVYGGAGNGQGSQYYDSTGGKGGGGASACAFPPSHLHWLTGWLEGFSTFFVCKPSLFLRTCVRAPPPRPALARRARLHPPADRRGGA